MLVIAGDGVWGVFVLGGAK